MGFFDNIKIVFENLWEGVKPNIWTVFQYALQLVIEAGVAVVAGTITKADARENAVVKVQKEFASDNPGLFSETLARMMVHFALAFYKKYGENNSIDILRYKNEPNFMEWYLSRPDKG